MTKVTKDGIETQSGKKIISSLVVWAAGIKAPEFLSHIKGIGPNHFAIATAIGKIQMPKNGFLC